MKPELIKLPNRYGTKNYIERVMDNQYVLYVSADEKDWMRMILREGYEWDDNEYHAVDPSGGPYISIDSILPGTNEIVERIYSIDDNIIINTRNNTKNNNYEATKE